MMEAHQNALSMNNQDIREAEVGRIALLKQQIQNLNQSIERITQQNQKLNRRLMMRTEHQCSDNGQMQKAAHPKLERE